MKKIIIIVFLIIISFGCASAKLMPKFVEEPVTAKEYNDVIQFYNSIKPHKTTIKDLRELTGIDLNNGQDITVLGPTYVRNLFMKNSFVKVEQLPTEVQSCIKLNGCIGYLMIKQRKLRNGVGRFFPRWLKFKKQDVVKEWRLEILVLATRDTEKIVYKEILSALPEQIEIKTKKNPLGPFQNLFGDVQYKYKF